jgi:L-asparaginase II
MGNPVLVEIMRGGIVESRHTGAVAVVDGDGKLVFSLGDIEAPVFPRSAVKALQALPLVESGAAARMKLTGAEIALASSSHSGEEDHAETAAGMLAKAGRDVTCLECGAHWPLGDKAARALASRGQTPSALHNNCSGKHAGFVCLAVDQRIDSKGYVGAEHAIMRGAAGALAEMTDFDLSRTAMGIDGCSIPTYAIPLRHLALGFARFGSGKGMNATRAAAAAAIRDAVAANPRMIAGTERFDTLITEVFGARVFLKTGAEGVYCAAMPEAGLGIALKMDDGVTRGSETAMAALIDGLLKQNEAERAMIAGRIDFRMTNWNGIEVGRMRPAAAWVAALAASGAAR